MKWKCSAESWPRLVPATVLAAIVIAACAPTPEPVAHTPSPISPAVSTLAGAPADPTATWAFTSDLATPIALTVTANSGRLPEAGEIRTTLPRDAIQAVLRPRFLSVDEANAVYDHDEPVLGIEIDGVARAYSIPFLSEHEIVNDEIAGRKIAVTW